MPIPDGIVKKGESVYWTGEGEFILYIPEFFFDMNFAVTEGEYISVLGVLTYSITDKSGKNGKIRDFYFPSQFATKPGRIEKVKDFSITDNYKTDYRILHYSNNGIDQVIASTKVVKTIDNVDNLFRLMVKTGKTPGTVRYDEMQQYIIDSAKINGVSFDFTVGLYGIIFGELCKDSNNLYTLFRNTDMPEKNPYGYKEISVVDAPKYVSPYASITSENFDEGVIGALNSKGEDAPTTFEKVFIG